jgi:ketosteroid isomerase-like protein
MKQKLSTLVFFIVLVVFFSIGCSNANTTKDSTPVFDVNAMKPVIEQKDKDWATAITISDSSKMVNHYTKDGKIFPPNSEPIVGRRAISDFVSAVMKYGIKEYKDETTALYGNEDNLVEEGTYTMGDGNGNTIDKGKYIAIWRKEDGDWKIFSNMYNSNLAPAPVKK